MALDPEAWDTPFGDGVRFMVRVREVGGEWETVVDEVVNPRANGDQRRWNDAVVPLRRWAGQRVEVTMTTDARGEPSNDWAVWGEPTVVMLDVLGAGRLERSAAWIAKVALARTGSSMLWAPVHLRRLRRLWTRALWASSVGIAASSLAVNVIPAYLSYVTSDLLLSTVCVGVAGAVGAQLALAIVVAIAPNKWFVIARAHIT